MSTLTFRTQVADGGRRVLVWVGLEVRLCFPESRNEAQHTQNRATLKQQLTTMSLGLSLSGLLRVCDCLTRCTQKAKQVVSTAILMATANDAKMAKIIDAKMPTLMPRAMASGVTHNGQGGGTAVASQQ